MTNLEVERFELFLWESFEKENLLLRELRLSDEEKVYIKEKFSAACIRLMPSGECQDGKNWYEVSLY